MLKNLLANIAVFATLIGLIILSIDFANVYGSVGPVGSVVSSPKSVSETKHYTPKEIKEARKWYKHDIEVHEHMCVMRVFQDLIDQGYVPSSIRHHWRKDEDLGCEVFWYDHPGGWGWKETNYLLYKPSFEEYCALYHQEGWPEVRKRLFDPVNEKY